MNTTILRETQYQKAIQTRLTGNKSDKESYDLSMDDDTGKELLDNQTIVIVMLLSNENKNMLYNNKKTKYKNYKTKFKDYQRNLESNKNRLNYMKLCLRLEILWKTI